jgi:hypothetical protein
VHITEIRREGAQRAAMLRRGSSTRDTRDLALEDVLGPTDVARPSALTRIDPGLLGRSGPRDSSAARAGVG